jgi:opacity protein-like surface antigen
MITLRGYGVTWIVVVMCIASPPFVLADQSNTLSAAQKLPPAAHKIGVQGFGGAAIDWLSSSDSFQAAGLDERPVEIGGGAQVTDIWRNLFAQVNAAWWSSTGERSFLDADGTRFGLGIPLDVSATFVDFSVGWKFYPTRNSHYWPYVGGGVGVVMYSEKSPFALPGDDVDVKKSSYHVFGGIEVPLAKWLGVAGEIRYRYTPKLLGEGGVSSVLEEDTFGQVQIGGALRVGFGGGGKRTVPPPPRRPPATAEIDPNQKKPEAPAAVGGDAVVAERAPVFLLPDTRRTPLRTLEPGTVLRILESTGDWLRVEFPDRQFGPRRGYIERKYVRPK